MAAPEAAKPSTAIAGGVVCKVLYCSGDGSTKVVLWDTPNHGQCVDKQWLEKRIRQGNNRAQPVSEYNSMLDLVKHHGLNTPVRINQEEGHVNVYYVNCGSDMERWRDRVWHEPAHMQQQAAEALAQHAALNVLITLHTLRRKGIVHRDVKPSNILMRGRLGRVWLSDCGLMAKAGDSRCGLGIDYNFLPPEYIEVDEAGSHRLVSGNAACAAVIRPAADMFMLGLTVYNLVTGSMPHSLRASSSCVDDPARLSALLGRVAAFDWAAEIQADIDNPLIAAFLESLLCNPPEQRPTAIEALQCSWLFPHLKTTMDTYQQHAEGWAAERQQALGASHYVGMMASMQAAAGSGGSQDGTTAAAIAAAVTAIAAAAAALPAYGATTTSSSSTAGVLSKAEDGGQVRQQQKASGAGSNGSAAAAGDASGSSGGGAGVSADRCIAWCVEPQIASHEGW